MRNPRVDRANAVGIAVGADVGTAIGAALDSKTLKNAEQASSGCWESGPEWLVDGEPDIVAPLVAEGDLMGGTAVRYAPAAGRVPESRA